MDLESLCTEIDANEGVITDELLARFNDAKLALSHKVDNWIGYLDSIKNMVETLKERKERVTRAYKVADGLQKRLREYLKFVMQASPSLPYKGEEGSLYLHGSPESVKYAFEFTDQTFYKIVDPTILQLEPSINDYVKVTTCYLIDGVKVKKDLKAGIKISWAELTKDSHVRVRG